MVGAPSIVQFDITVLVVLSYTIGMALACARTAIMPATATTTRTKKNVRFIVTPLIQTWSTGYAPPETLWRPLPRYEHTCQRAIHCLTPHTNVVYWIRAAGNAPAALASIPRNPFPESHHPSGPCGPSQPDGATLLNATLLSNNSLHSRNTPPPFQMVAAAASPRKRSNLLPSDRIIIFIGSESRCRIVRRNRRGRPRLSGDWPPA